MTVRVFRRLAFGAEWGGAVPDGLEHAPWQAEGHFHRHGPCRFPVGLLLANMLVGVHLGSNWAWQVPFLCSIFLVIFG